MLTIFESSTSAVRRLSASFSASSALRRFSSASLRKRSSSSFRSRSKRSSSSCGQNKNGEELKKKKKFWIG